MFQDLQLFPSAPTSDARISPCGRYRYSLTRRWAPGPPLAFIMLNPSTADASVDDPTIRRCIGFAKTLRFGGIEVVNLYAFRSTDPDAMLARRRTADIIGPYNDDAIVDAARMAGKAIAAWGTDNRARDRAFSVLECIRPIADVYCLAKSKDGLPRHPLYLKADLQPELYRARYM